MIKYLCVYDRYDAWANSRYVGTKFVYEKEQKLPDKTHGCSTYLSMRRIFKNSGQVMGFDTIDDKVLNVMED